MRGFIRKMNTNTDTATVNEARKNAAFLAAGQIRALADIAGVTIDIYPFFYGGKIEVLMEGMGENSVNAFVKKAAYELSLFADGGDYAPLGEVLDVLKKRAIQEIQKVEGFVNGNEFRFMDTNGITTVPIEDGKVLIRGRIHHLELHPDDEQGNEFTAYPEV